ncbi:MAG: imidazole glycerol phosphate synthase subunit HisF [Gemmatimonadetes bacterium]|nr:imidazole glycerol phosphate synthase subunit HisF [Gemmatimonadota bacterium]MYG85297.1 imidazole glycerol phosphate synthase subunit HisF [Gemmatimonadota bacterium]MYJ88964.1 imidazole glycerol phosphate synthase subunit HisF [Gemmatimonadota bacterium]
MLSKRLISCLDVRDGRLVKSVRFVNTKDIGDPVSAARRYYEAGLDELVFYDITASSDQRAIMLDVVEEVARQVFIPFSVGGGLRSVDDCRQVLEAGAEKVNLNTAAVSNPGVISEAADAFGVQAVVLSMDIRAACSGSLTTGSGSLPSGYEIVTHGGRRDTGMDALEWARRGEALGAGEIVVNSIDADGTLEGYELKLTRMIADNVGIPVIASGGGGRPEHLYDALTEGGADAALVASMLHYGHYSVDSIKHHLHDRGLKIRMTN